MPEQTLLCKINATSRDRLLALASPASLLGAEPSRWCVVHALATTGLKNVEAFSCLMHCLSNLYICKVRRSGAYDTTIQDTLTKDSMARLEHSMQVAVGDEDPDYANRHAEREATQITPRTKCSGCGRLASDWTRGFRKHEAQCQRTPAPDKENTAQACRNRSSRAGSKSQHSPVAPLRQPAHVNTSSQHQVGARLSRPARRGR